MTLAAFISNMDNYSIKLISLLYISVHLPYYVYTLITVHLGLYPLLKK